MIQHGIKFGISHVDSFCTKTLRSIRSKALRKSSRSTLAVAPFPSVLTSQLYVMLISACVVDELGIVPNCLWSISFNTAGLTYCLTIWFSVILDRIGVSEIGRRCLFTSFIGFCFGTGTTSASFQDDGRRPSRYEEFRISVIGLANKSAFSFNSQPGILSGPCALVTLSADRLRRTDSSDTVAILLRFHSLIVHCCPGRACGEAVQKPLLESGSRVDVICQVLGC